MSCIEVPLYEGRKKTLEGNSKRYDLARIMCNYWANFIKTGDPNGKDADGTPMPEWPAYTEKKPAVMHFHEDPQKLGAKVEEPDELMKIFIDARVKGVSSDGTLGG